MVRRRWWVGCMLAAGWSAGATAGEPLPAPKGYACGKVAAPIVVDGALDDPGWQSAPWTDDFVDIEGSKKPLPRLRTRAKMAWDADYLYVAAEMAEPHVWGNLTAHDSIIFQDNDFELFLDPDGDNHKYFEVEVNALNTEWDLFLRKPYRDGGPAENSWEIPGLKKAVKILGTINDPSDEDIGWTVELAIPWASLAQDAGTRTPPGDGDRWRINFSRVEWETTVEGDKYVKVKVNGKVKPEGNWVWSPQGVVDMHQPERWGYLQFSTEAPGVAPVRPDPDAVVRDRLMAIYHARKALAKAGKPWKGTLEELDLDPGDFRVKGASLPVVHLTPGGFEAVMSGPPVEGHTPRIWAVDQDGRLTAR